MASLRQLTTAIVFAGLCLPNWGVCSGEEARTAGEYMVQIDRYELQALLPQRVSEQEIVTLLQGGGDASPKDPVETTRATAIEGRQCEVEFVRTVAIGEKHHNRFGTTLSVMIESREPKSFAHIRFRYSAIPTKHEEGLQIVSDDIEVATDRYFRSGKPILLASQSNEVLTVVLLTITQL